MPAEAKACSARHGVGESPCSRAGRAVKRARGARRQQLAQLGMLPAAVGERHHRPPRVGRLGPGGLLVVRQHRAVGVDGDEAPMSAYSGSAPDSRASCRRSAGSEGSRRKCSNHCWRWRRRCSEGRRLTLPRNGRGLDVMRRESSVVEEAAPQGAVALLPKSAPRSFRTQSSGNGPWGSRRKARVTSPPQRLNDAPWLYPRSST